MVKTISVTIGNIDSQIKQTKKEIKKQNWKEAEEKITDLETIFRGITNGKIILMINEGIRTKKGSDMREI